MRKQVRSADFIDLGADRLSKVQYFRKKGWSAPHNLFADGSELIALSGAAGRPPADPGWVFSAAPPPGGRPVSAVTVRYPGTAATLTWSSAEDRWLMAMGGSPMRTVEGPQLGPKTAVIQYAKVEKSGSVDVGGNSSPFVQTVGSGKALILRDGQAYDAAVDAGHGAGRRSATPPPTARRCRSIPARCGCCWRGQSSLPPRRPRCNRRGGRIMGAYPPSPASAVSPSQ